MTTGPQTPKGYSDASSSKDHCDVATERKTHGELCVHHVRRSRAIPDQASLALSRARRQVLVKDALLKKLSQDAPCAMQGLGGHESRAVARVRQEKGAGLAVA